MFCVLGVVALLVSGSIALDENEWTEKITGSFELWTKYMNARNLEGVLGLYHEPMVEMIPGKPAMDRTAFKKYLGENQNKDQLTLELQELIYTTADMALARYVSNETTGNGCKIIWKGVRMFLLQDDNENIKIRADIFNKD